MGSVRGHKTGITETDDTFWQPENTSDLATSIMRIERELPGWWWSVGACHVSSDASCAPDRYGPDATLLSDPEFDEGFHADIRQPSTCADALNDVIDQALQAKQSAKK
jgi:hypothetical protein